MLALLERLELAEAVAVEVVQSKKNPEVYKFVLSGKAGRIAVAGYTETVHIGIDRIRKQTADGIVNHVNREGGGKLPYGARTKVVAAVWSEMQKLAKKHDVEISEF